MIINSFGYMAIVVVKAKSMHKWYFLVSEPILKFFPRLIFYPSSSYAKNDPKQVFTGLGFI